jgi:predicted MFS family arabinose efflux permease
MKIYLLFKRIINKPLPHLTKIMIIMGFFLTLVQVNRVGGSVVANALSSIHQLTPAEIGVVIGVMFLSSALVQIPFGIMLDRFGARRMIVGWSSVAIIGTVIFGLAETSSGLTVGRILIGIGHGASITGVYLLALAWATPERVASVAATTIAVAGALGGMIGTAPLAASIQYVGFTDTFLYLAVVSLLSSILIWFFVDDRPSGARRENTKENSKTAILGLFEVIKDRNLWPIFAMALCFSVPFATIGGLWVGPFLRDIHGLSPTSAGSIIFLMVLCVNLGTYIYGPLDRIFNTRKWVVLTGVSLMIVNLLGLAIFPTTHIAFIVVMLCVFSISSPIFVTLAGHCRGYVPENHAGRALTFVNFLGVGFIFILQSLTGSLVEVFLVDDHSMLSGYRLVFGIVAMVLLISGTLYLFSRDAKPFPNK